MSVHASSMVHGAASIAYHTAAKLSQASLDLLTVTVPVTDKQTDRGMSGGDIDRID